MSENLPVLNDIITKQDQTENLSNQKDINKREEENNLGNTNKKNMPY